MKFLLDRDENINIYFHNKIVLSATPVKTEVQAV